MGNCITSRHLDKYLSQKKYSQYRTISSKTERTRTEKVEEETLAKETLTQKEVDTSSFHQCDKSASKVTQTKTNNCISESEEQNMSNKETQAQGFTGYRTRTSMTDAELWQAAARMTESVESDISNVGRGGRKKSESDYLSGADSNPERGRKNFLPRNPTLDETGHMSIIETDMYEKMTASVESDISNVGRGGRKKSESDYLSGADSTPERGRKNRADSNPERGRKNLLLKNPSLDETGQMVIIETDMYEQMTASVESVISNVGRGGRKKSESDYLSSYDSNPERDRKNLLPKNPTLDETGHVAIIATDMYANIRRQQLREKYNKLCRRWEYEIMGTLPEVEENKRLCGVLMITYDRELLQFQKALGNISTVLLNPFKSELKEFPKNYQEEFLKLPEGLKEEVMHWILRKMNDPSVWGDDSMLIKTLAEQKYIEQDDLEDMFSNEQFKTFLTDTADFCRDMLMQNPKWRFSKEKLMQVWKDEFNEFVTPMEGSNEKEKRACIRYYYKPVIYVGDQVIEKGVAYVDAWKKVAKKK